MRRADKHAAVSARRRIPVEHQQARLQEVADFLERDRTNRRHRPKIREHAKDAPRPAQHTRRQVRQPIEPFTPVGRLRPVAERIDDRQGELAEVAQIPLIAEDRGAARRIHLLAFELRQPQAVLRREAVEPAPPPLFPFRPIGAADHRRLDDQLFPFPGRAERTGDDGFLVGIGRNRARRSVRLGRIARGAGKPRIDLVVRNCFPRRRRRVKPRHLAEREVLVEAFRREFLARTREQGDEGAPGRIRTPRAAIEVCRRASPLERVLDEAKVLAGAAKADCHFVEANAGFRLVEGAARNLERLACFSGRRKQADIAGPRPRWRRQWGEDVAPQPSQVGFRVGVVVDTRDRHAFRFERRDRRFVSGGDGEQRSGRPPAHREREPALGGRRQRHVDHEQRTAGPASRRPRIGRRLEQRGTVGDRRSPQLVVDAFQQPGQIRQRVRCGRRRNQRRRRNAGETKFVQCPGERRRKAGHLRHGREIRQLAAAKRVERRPRRHGLGVRGGACDLSRSANRDGGRAGRELGQTESVQTECGALERHRAGEVVGGAACGGDDEQFGVGRKTGGKGTSGADARLRG